MDYADIVIDGNKININFKNIAVNDKHKTQQLVERYKELVLEHTKIRLVVDCSKLLSVSRSIALVTVKTLRKFEDQNIHRFVDKTIVITKPSLRVLANLIMKFFPPVVKTTIVSSL